MIEWADEARTRQGLYRFIGAALRPPESERLALLASAQEVLESRDLDRYAYLRYWRCFADAMGAGPSIEELEIEYVRLFGVGMADTPVMPTESYYRVPTKDGGIADFISAIQREYRSMGVVSNAAAEAPDHISTEMEVMSHLCGVEAEAWESGQEEVAVKTMRWEARFLSGHLAGWVPVLAEKALAARANRFYGSLVNLTHAFVVHETDYVRAVAGRTVLA